MSALFFCAGRHVALAPKRRQAAVSKTSTFANLHQLLAINRQTGPGFSRRLFSVFYLSKRCQPVSLEKTRFGANPLVMSVLRENVRICGERAHIELWPNWPVLLADVQV